MSNRPAPRYYSLRRFTPYQGVIQVVDVGNARAYSTDGRHWQVRIQQAGSRGRGSVPGREPLTPATGDDLMQALNTRPALPFPFADHIELWLLNRDSLQPLALLKTRCSLAEISDIDDPGWRPFLPGQHAFRSAALERARAAGRRYALPAHDLLERQVNSAARPRPVAQWIERRPDGSGIGHGGLRVDARLHGRELPPEAFPELLVSEQWADEVEAGIAADYHDWNAALLLAHQNLTRRLRARLERAARVRPERLLDNHAMFPEILDPEAMEVALVSARLIRAHH